MIKIKKNILIFISLFLLISCQSSTTTKEVIFDNSVMAKINFHTEKININNNYDMKLADSYIDYTIEKPPIFYLNGWIEENISYFGSENLLEINILQASLSKIERKIENNKSYVNQNEFYYELIYQIEFKILDDKINVLAKILSEVKRSTTSSNFISLNEEQQIIDNLILNSLTDLSFKTEELVQKHMYQYML
tara:strand:+ start:6170 stop:6748 length:579 start_codon:yes stop_codon:yes gene_type:complete